MPQASPAPAASPTCSLAPSSRPPGAPEFATQFETLVLRRAWHAPLFPGNVQGKVPRAAAAVRQLRPILLAGKQGDIRGPAPQSGQGNPTRSSHFLQFPLWLRACASSPHPLLSFWGEQRRLLLGISPLDTQEVSWGSGRRFRRVQDSCSQNGDPPAVLFMGGAREAGQEEHSWGHSAPSREMEKCQMDA